MKLNDTLFVVPARGGSKGLPGKNIRDLCGKPLIAYSIDIARAFADDNNICVSTDSAEIKDVVEKYGLKVPFLRPESLATDSASSNDVLVHAVRFYKDLGRDYKKICLLQPTSPLRSVNDVQGSLDLYSDDVDMVVSVVKSHAPAVLCADDENGFVQLIYNKNAEGRQQLKEMYEFNGAVYVINVESLLEKGMKNFSRKVKYVMSKEHSVDIDDIYDFKLVESMMKEIQSIK
ncbi:acylneuraminate cytidylyltransferase family protein [Candidatus Saccharibacteria bacterium]|nr:acylneuraminate cytidylyltransferase family protein [Candidatus Saccharibacteria bacterium]